MDGIVATLNECGHTSAGAGLQFFALLIQSLFQQQCSISPPSMWPQDYGPTAQEQGLEQYDYIVIGAGSAGSVVASRLSENPRKRVLLLEAGGNPPIESEIPLLALAMQKTQYTWDYYLEKNDYSSLGYPNGAYLPRGKLLGGSGAINYMLYVRGNRRDYNHWEELGNPTWGWNNVLQYFKKSEDNKVIKNKFHGQNGLLKVNKYGEDTYLHEVIMQAAIELGYKELSDVNAEEHIGYNIGLGTLNNGTRSSPAKAFLIPAMNRPNLNIIKNAFVTKINISADKKATGVEFVLHGQTLTATMKKEIILSAGAINSPQLLMLSGIGPQDELEKHGIPLIQELPVGENLQDHIAVPFFLSFRKSSVKAETTPEFLNNVFQYSNNRSGPFAGFGLSNLMGFVNTENKTDPFPDIQFLHILLKKQTPDLNVAISLFGFDDKIAESIRNANQDGDTVMVFVTLLNVKSRGNIKLRSKDPYNAPIINENNLKKKSDVKTLVRGIKIVRKMLKTDCFRNNEGEEVPIDLPKCNSLNRNSNEYLECYVRHLSTPVYHPAGSVKMGPDSDAGAVVDSKLRVKGVKKLRVVDASIMPTIASCNINAPTIMIGEKASDMIKADA